MFSQICEDKGNPFYWFNWLVMVSSSLNGKALIYQEMEVRILSRELVCTLCISCYVMASFTGTRIVKFVLLCVLGSFLIETPFYFFNSIIKLINMCLLTHNPECKTAEKPIKVWKLLEKDKEKLVTPMMRQSVKIGETVYAKNPDKPLHKRTVPTFLNGRVKEDAYYEIDEQGVHAYIQKEQAEAHKVEYYRSFRTNIILTEWEIPKGTKYWVGDYLSPNHIVATKMKFVKICK